MGVCQDSARFLFAVEDHSGKVALSVECEGAVWMATIDVDRLQEMPTWRRVAGPEDTQGARIADHWHTFAHGLHWIVFSVQRADQAYLLALDPDFERVGLAQIVDHKATPKVTSSRPPAKGASPPTNDMFLVADPEGVAVGFYLPATGHRVMRFDTDLQARDAIVVGGNQWQHANGSSALAVPEGFLLLAADQMDGRLEGGIRLIHLDEQWTPTRSRRLVRGRGVNVGMVSGALLPNHTLVVHARYREGAKPLSERTPPPKGTISTPTRLPPNSGTIVRYRVCPSGRRSGPEVLYPATDGDRPHTILIGDRLVTTWDSRMGAHLRVDALPSQVAHPEALIGPRRWRACRQ